MVKPPDLPLQLSIDPGFTRIGIDMGGTFTDFVVLNPVDGQITSFKLLSTPDNPSEVVLEGLRKIYYGHKAFQDPSFTGKQRVHIIHGSTVATNALLERKGACTALVTTHGFRDVIQIGRQNRPVLYSLAPEGLSPLVPGELRFEVNERVDSHGGILTPLEPVQIDQLVSELQLSPLMSGDLRSIAVCLLFSYANPLHESMIAEQLRSAGFFVCASHEILSEFREYERTSTTVVNAYVSPILDRYLSRLEEWHTSNPVNALQPQNNTIIRIMQSNGGQINLAEARRNGVRCILSGPAGGVIGANYVTRLAAKSSGNPGVRVITMDMGGTSTDVSLMDGKTRLTNEAVIGGYPIHIPVLDIHTIGAGGGSIATSDRGGALRVGPQSAGADPGPACYDRGGNCPTVTDANLVLGRLTADQLLGDQIQLNLAQAQHALSRLASELGLGLMQTALGIVEVVNAHMERALRVISIERGYDPREFSLLSFGGAGGLHAMALAHRLGIPRVVIPPLASTLSAFGMLAADVVKDYSQTVMLLGNVNPIEIESALAPLLTRGRSDLLTEGIEPADILIEQMVDIRYQGQSYELTIPFDEQYISKFHAAHQHIYGYCRQEAQLEIVTVRVRATGKIIPPYIAEQPFAGSQAEHALIDTRPVMLDDGVIRNLHLYRGESLLCGNLIPGPALIVRSDTTVLIGPDDRILVDPFLNLIINWRDIAA